MNPNIYNCDGMEKNKQTFKNVIFSSLSKIEKKIDKKNSSCTTYGKGKKKEKTNRVDFVHGSPNGFAF